MRYSGDALKGATIMSDYMISTAPITAASVHSNAAMAYLTRKVDEYEEPRTREQALEYADRVLSEWEAIRANPAPTAAQAMFIAMEEAGMPCSYGFKYEDHLALVVEWLRMLDSAVAHRCAAALDSCAEIWARYRHIDVIWTLHDIVLNGADPVDMANEAHAMMLKLRYVPDEDGGDEFWAYKDEYEIAKMFA